MIALFKQDPAAALDKTRRKLSNVEDNIASLRAKRAEVLLSSEDAGAVVTRPSPMCLEAIGNRMSMCMAIRLNGKLEAQHRFSMSRGGLPNATSPPSAALSAQQPRRPNVSGLVGLRLPRANSDQRCCNEACAVRARVSGLPKRSGEGRTVVLGHRG